MAGTLGSGCIRELSVVHRCVSLGYGRRLEVWRVDGLRFYNSRPANPKADENVSSARILVVDDDANVRQMLVDYLGTHGYDVVAAANGTQMRAALERQVPDVVLLDVGLPARTG